MPQVIIYRRDDGGVQEEYPTPEALEVMDIHEIARIVVPSPKEVYDVPTGVFETDEETGEVYEVMGPRLKTYPYKILDVSELPTDFSQRDLWTVDERDLTDGVGA